MAAVAILPNTAQLTHVETVVQDVHTVLNLVRASVAGLNDRLNIMEKRLRKLQDDVAPAQNMQQYMDQGFERVRDDIRHHVDDRLGFHRGGEQVPLQARLDLINTRVGDVDNRVVDLQAHATEGLEAVRGSVAQSRDSINTRIQNVETAIIARVDTRVQDAQEAIVRRIENAKTTILEGVDTPVQDSQEAILRRIEHAETAIPARVNTRVQNAEEAIKVPIIAQIQVAQTALQGAVATVQNRVGGGVEALQLEIRAGHFNDAARLANKSAGCCNASISKFHGTKNNRVQGFPATYCELSRLDEHETNAILEQLALDTRGNVVKKKKRLKTYLGLRT